MQDKHLIIIGASARSAAFSAARAGFEPYWIDQFGDCDLRDSFAGTRIAPKHYPAGLTELVANAPEVPWLYTGALENHLRILDQIVKQRPLLGNDGKVCEEIRDPLKLVTCFDRADIPRLKIEMSANIEIKEPGYLMKPVHSAGGIGISIYADRQQLPEGYYLQEYIEGDSVSAVYIGSGTEAYLLGVTQQLVGDSNFHASAFGYCGSIGPLTITPDEQQQWMTIGQVLVNDFGLRGLFGVDAINKGGMIVPVEVNPRYTASVEVIELATGLPAIALHAEACTGHLSDFDPLRPSQFIGKAFLFAANDLRTMMLKDRLNWNNEDGFPRLADIPQSGSRIYKGNPIMTLLVSGQDASSCREKLNANANRMYEMFD